jgi:uncharacterized protein (DUF924 family)
MTGESAIDRWWAKDHTLGADIRGRFLLLYEEAA